MIMVMGQKSSLCPVVAKKSPVWHYLLVCDILWLNKICIFWGIQINIKINKALLLQKSLDIVCHVNRLLQYQSFFKTFN